jgi:hypothetical protein
MRMRRALAAATLASCVLMAATGCSAELNINDSAIGPVPRCNPTTHQSAGAIVLVAQSVPTARMLPCVRTIAAGWAFERLDARDGHATLLFNAAGGTIHPVAIAVQRRCSVGVAVQRPSDQPGAIEYEQVTRNEESFVGKRFYVFPGGCVTYKFSVHGDTFVAMVDALLQGLGFVTREELASKVRELSNGRLELDAKGGGS